MQALNNQELLTIWEWGQTQSMARRGLTMLSMAAPEQSALELAQLPIGTRNQMRLRLREKTFGTCLQSLVVCPQCGEKLEFEIQTTVFQENEPSKASDDALSEVFLLTQEGIDCRFRLVNSEDLLALEQQTNHHLGHQLLLERCVLEVKRGEQRLELQDYPSALTKHLSKQLSEHDPLADILLDLGCEACGYQWQPLFDIVAYFWAEIAAKAKSLLWEVHCLAQTYGWREADILAMTPQRRASYLEMVGV